TIARALQQIMDEPYVHTGLDHFLPRVPQQFFEISAETDLAPTRYFRLLYETEAQRAVGERDGGETVFGLGDFRGLQIGQKGMELLAGMYRGMAALASAGVNIVVEDVIHDERLLRAASDAFTDLTVLFVGLQLPREVARQRERER